MSTNLAAIMGGAFNPENVAETNAPEFTVLPKGDYRVIIEASEIKPTKAGNGQILTLRLKVFDETSQYNGRTLFDMLCVVHTSQVAQNIAQTKLKHIAESLKLKQVSDSTQLHDKPLIAHIQVEKDAYMTEQKGETMYRNNVKSYAPVQQSAPVLPGDTMSDDVPF